MDGYNVFGVFLLLVSTVLTILTSVSLPYLPNTDIVRVHFKSGNITQGTVMSPDISQLRFGIWSYCALELPSGNRNCSDNGYAYSVVFLDKNSTHSVTIGSSWTRGLAIHPVSAGITFIALLTAFFFPTIVTAVVATLAALTASFASCVDLALYCFVRYQVRKLQPSNSQTDPSLKFWMDHFQTDISVGFWLGLLSTVFLGVAYKGFY